ncbi:enoyl-CoA hydratase-related protein [Zavarzinia sp. CC-PAN008]|uniref:enoyl-CoA hydratase-related protein n=1 Tax=Zavarzinia sp. CC-PAN008 TaxID=3243332 RepID=UPI003F7476E9
MNERNAPDQTGHVVTQVKDRVAIITLNRPDRLNALTHPMIKAVRTAADAAAADPEVIGIVITGMGRAFSAGLDADALVSATQAGAAGQASARESAPPPDELPALFSHFLTVPKPVIAAINGVAAGGGFVLALMADLRFSAETGAFTTVFSKRGLIAEHGTSWILPRLTGLSRALDLLWSSRKIDAEEAYRIGLVDRIVPAEHLVAEACAYLHDLAANISPRSIAVIKAQVHADLSRSLHDSTHATAPIMYEALQHPDAREGAASFIERRPPRFARLGG